MADGTPSVNRADTTPKLLLENARVRGSRPANREKDLGIWLTWSWSQIADEIKNLACGLKKLGVEPGDKVCICGDNRPHLYWAITAVQTLRAIPVPVYQDSIAEEMQYVYEHAEAKFAVVEDQEQVDKLLEIKDRLPSLKHIVYKDPRGMLHYDEDFLHDYVEIQKQGLSYADENPDFYADSINQGQGEDIAIMLYTSGTTGRPKGVILSFDNLIISAANANAREGLTEKEEILAYLSMAWIGDNIFSHAQAYAAGFCVSCPESGETVLDDLREIGPTYFFAPPRIFESILTTIMIRIEDAAKFKQHIFHYFMEVASRVGADILDGKLVPAKDRFLYWLGNILVYAPLMNVLGLSRAHLCFTAGEAIGPDIFKFYRSLGLNLKQLYGSTESAVFITMQPDRDVRFDTVGTPATDVEVKITDEGEIMFRSPGTFQSYYKNEEETRAIKEPDGWVHTGDAGFFDPDGHLKIIDRAKDVGKLNDGTLFAPKYLENKLKFFPYISEAVTFGDGRDYVAAFICMDLEAVGNWAEKQNLAYSGYTDLAGQELVGDFIQVCVEKVNQDLSNDEKLAGSQIKRYLILHKDLDADDGELTRTRKVRRRTIAEKYADLIDALYSGATHCSINAMVTFEDGRTGSIEADLQIRDANTINTTAAAEAAE
ncbi:MAG: AMP-binding protein [Rhodospirillales bacterium]